MKMFNLDNLDNLDDDVINEKPRKTSKKDIISAETESTPQNAPKSNVKTLPQNNNMIYIETIARDYVTKYRRDYNKYMLKHKEGEPKPHMVKCYEWILKQGWSQ